jgi:NTE family protein
MDIPGVAPPIAAQGRLLVDGGLLNNLPVDVMAAAGEGPVIAVDVGGSARMVLGDVQEERLDGEPSARRRSRVLVNDEEDLDVLLPTLPELMTRIVTLSASDSAALAAEHSDLVIRPQVSHVGTFEFHMLDTLKAAGRPAGGRRERRSTSAPAPRPRAGHRPRAAR